MRELSLIVQTSLDGFVAGVKGEFDNFIGGEENLEFVCSVTDDADAILLGRVSYQLLNSFWPKAADKPGATENEKKYSTWYNSVPKFVLSGTLKVENSSNPYVISKKSGNRNRLSKTTTGQEYLNFWQPYSSPFPF